MRRCLFSRPTVTLVRLHTQNLLSSRLRAERIALLRMTKTATLALHPPFQVTMVQSCIRRNQQFTPSPITQAFSFPKSMRPIYQKRLTTSPLTKPLTKLRTTVPIQFPRLLKFNSRKLTNILWCRLLKSVSKQHTPQQKRYPQQGTQSQKLSTPPATPSAPLSQQ